MTQARASNEEFVNALMSYSSYGPLMQVFVIEALRSYSESVSKSVPSEEDNGIISARTWHAIACDLQRAFQENYATPLEH